jgi:multidrug resistance protein MdtO
LSSPSWSERLCTDLQPSPGRLAATLRIVLATVVALVLMMVLQLPFAALGLYYVFLVARETPAVSMKSGIISLLTLALAVAVELGVVIVSDNSPVVRVLSVAVVSYVSGTLMMASTLPALASIWGFIYCTLIALWELRVPPDALVKASLQLIATVALAFLCSVIVEYVFAWRRPDERLEELVGMRYKAIETAFTLFAQGAPPGLLGEAIVRVNRLAAVGQNPMVELYKAIAARGLKTGTLPVGTRARISMLAQLMDVSAAFASQHSAGVDESLRGRCAEIARRCRDRNCGQTVGETIERSVYTGNSLLDRVEAALESILSMPPEIAALGEEDLVALPANKVPFLIPGALTSRATAAFALKLTLCVMVCYIFYFAVAWPGISTSVTTVFIVAIGSSGAIKQKLANRFLGSAIGGALAIGATIFLFPEMDSITSLVLLIAGVAFIAAWWAAGRQFGYAGLQIAFAFYLVAFEGLSAPTELAPARDRLVGILVALAVIWLVFDQLWPVRTVTAMRQALASVLRCEARFMRIFESDEPRRVQLNQVDGVRDQVGKTISGLRTMNDNVLYEFGIDREEQIRKGEMILEAALTAVPFFWNQLVVLHNEKDRDFVTEPGLVDMRRRVAVNMDAMADAVSQGRTFTIVPATSLADSSMLASPRFGEYAANTVASLEELQARVSAVAAPNYSKAAGGP